jgi:hypothetical protein
MDYDTTKTGSKQGGKRYSPRMKFYGAMIPNWLLRRTDISHGAKLCFGRLMQFAGRNDHCFPDQETLAEEVGVSVRTIQEYLAELESKPYIESQRRGRGNVYYFVKHPDIKFKRDTKHPSCREHTQDSSPDEHTQDSASRFDSRIESTSNQEKHSEGKNTAVVTPLVLNESGGNATSEAAAAQRDNIIEYALELFDAKIVSSPPYGNESARVMDNDASMKPICPSPTSRKFRSDMNTPPKSRYLLENDFARAGSRSGPIYKRCKIFQCAFKNDAAASANELPRSIAHHEIKRRPKLPSNDPLMALMVEKSGIAKARTRGKSSAPVGKLTGASLVKTKDQLPRWKFRARRCADLRHAVRIRRRVLMACSMWPTGNDTRFRTFGRVNAVAE